MDDSRSQSRRKRNNTRSTSRSKNLAVLSRFDKRNPGKSPGSSLSRASASRSRGKIDNSNLSETRNRMFSPQNAYPDPPKKSMNKALKQKHK